MEIIEKSIVGDIYYFTVKSVNKYISVAKIINLIDNADDYIDKDGFDKECFKEDVLEPRDYLVTINGEHATCTCKNELFRKTTCRHVTYVLNYMNENGKKI